MEECYIEKNTQTFSVIRYLQEEKRKKGKAKKKKTRIGVG